MSCKNEPSVLHRFLFRLASLCAVFAMFAHVCICMCVCVCVYAYVCMCMYVYMYVCMYIRGGHSSANAPIVALTSCCVALNTNSKMMLHHTRAKSNRAVIDIDDHARFI